MKRLATTAAALVLASLAAASCGRPAEQTPAQEGVPAAVPAPPATGASQALDITFRTEPDPPKAGDTAVEVSVTGPGSQPVTDADVSVRFYMAAMPEIKMPEMQNTIPLSHQGGGRYQGRGSIMMAGKWDATVSVKRGGQEIGRRTFAVTAQ